MAGAMPRPAASERFDTISIFCEATAGVIAIIQAFQSARGVSDGRRSAAEPQRCNPIDEPARLLAYSRAGHGSCDARQRAPCRRRPGPGAVAGHTTHLSAVGELRPRP